MASPQAARLTNPRRSAIGPLDKPTPACNEDPRPFTWTSSTEQIHVRNGQPGPQRDAWVLAVIATPDCVDVLIIRFANHMITENVQVFGLSRSVGSPSATRP